MGLKPYPDKIPVLFMSEVQAGLRLLVLQEEMQQTGNYEDIVAEEEISFT